MFIIDQWREFLLPEEIFKVQHIWQLITIIVLLAVCIMTLKSKSEQDATKQNSPILWLKRNRPFLVLWVLISVIFATCKVFDVVLPVFRFFSLLGILWIIIGLLTGFIHTLFWARSLNIAAYFVTGVFSLFPIQESVQFLRGFSFTIGAINISAWSILSGLFAFVFTLWLVLAIAGVIETQIQHIPRLSPSLKVLIAKILRILFIMIAAAVAMSSMGVDLSALTVLSGAVGLGVGFGLQKVVSNFISGILLLVDNSIKPGDVIQIDDTYGWINNLRARYASIITRDGTEHLIPNEDLITQRVTNWTFSNNLVRMKVPIGVSYGSDPHQCIRLVVEATESVERVLKDPKPICLLIGFGDSSVDLEVRFWISDPINGVSNVKSEVLLNVWDTFKEHGIEIPFPQRDLHIRSSSVDFQQDMLSERT